ncbi:hypothetical protein C8F01DRAFT_1261223 [Mycena amicta]|nr:hypothetical protein C8F01DRAFT_1261223 [Mycena amicta]
MSSIHIDDTGTPSLLERLRDPNIREKNERPEEVEVAMEAERANSKVEVWGSTGCTSMMDVSMRRNSGRGTFARAPIAIHDHLHNSSVSITTKDAFIGVLEFKDNGSAFDDFAFDEKGRARVTVHPGALALFTPQKNGN